MKTGFTTRDVPFREGLRQYCRNPCFYVLRDPLIRLSKPLLLRANRPPNQGLRRHCRKPSRNGTSLVVNPAFVPESQASGRVTTTQLTPRKSTGSRNDSPKRARPGRWQNGSISSLLRNILRCNDMQKRMCILSNSVPAHVALRRSSHLPR